MKRRVFSIGSEINVCADTVWVKIGENILPSSEESVPSKVLSKGKILGYEILKSTLHVWVEIQWIDDIKLIGCGNIWGDNLEDLLTLYSLEKEE